MLPTSEFKRRIKTGGGMYRRYTKIDLTEI